MYVCRESYKATFSKDITIDNRFNKSLYFYCVQTSLMARFVVENMVKVLRSLFLLAPLEFTCPEQKHSICYQVSGPPKFQDMKHFSDTSKIFLKSDEISF